MTTFHEKCGILVDDLAFKVGTDYFDILPMVTSCSLDIVCGIYYDFLSILQMTISCANFRDCYGCTC